MTRSDTTELPAIGTRFSDDDYDVVRVSGWYWNESQRWVEICNLGHGANLNRRLVRLGHFYDLYTEAP
jgi:hypothetical protein